jgi:serine/threonine-protein kinase
MMWVAAAVVVTAIVTASVLWFSRDTGVALPDVVGMEFPQAAAVLKAVALVAERREQPVDDARPGTVVSQDPPAGTSVSGGTRVAVIVAVAKVPPVATASRDVGADPAAPASPPAAPAVVAIPDLRGQTAERAAELLAAAGLTVGSRSEDASNDVSLGTVLAQKPDATQSAAQGSSVDLIVAARRLAPPLTGATLDDAQQTLGRLGLTQRVERVRASARERDNQVIGQQPAAGTALAPGGELVLSVATVAPKTVSGGDQLFRTNGQRCVEICRKLGLTFKGQWSGARNTCTCEF